MTLRRALVLALAGLCVVLAARSCIVARGAEAVRAENARLRSEAARARLEAHGYQTTLAHVTANLRRTLAERDHWRALAEEPDVKPVAYVRATAEAASRVEGPVEPMDRFTAPDDSIAVGMSPIGDTIPFPGFEGVAADHVFAVRWQLRLIPERRFLADVRARVPLELVAYRLPDDAIGVTAVSPDPRIRIEVEEFYWQPPKQPGPSRWKWLLAGVAIGMVGWEAIR